MSADSLASFGLGADDDAPEPSDDRDDEIQGRVTVDLDGYTERFEFKAVRAYHALEREADEVTVAISSGGEGLHLVGLFHDPLEFAERERLRHHLGDDEKRIAIDQERHQNGIYTGVLWASKDDPGGPQEAREHGEKQRGFRDVYDALDAIRASTSDPSDRMQALAEHGHKGAPRLAGHAGRWDA